MKDLYRLTYTSKMEKTMTILTSAESAALPAHNTTEIRFRHPTLYMLPYHRCLSMYHEVPSYVLYSRFNSSCYVEKQKQNQFEHGNKKIG